MKKVVEDRHSVRVFTKQDIPEDILGEIMGYSLRCPTSMNTQPFKMVLIRDKEKKDQLACCMDEGNDTTVRTSSATVIVCADQDPMKLVDESGEYVLTKSESWMARLFMRISLMMYYRNTLFTFLFGWILDLVLSIYRLFATSPARYTRSAWSYQQTSFLMQDIVILAESKGISSLIMEGFNEKAVRECIKLPKRYQVAGIISLGYEPENGQVKPSARFPFDQVIYDGSWNKSFYTVCLSDH